MRVPWERGNVGHRSEAARRAAQRELSQHVLGSWDRPRFADEPEPIVPPPLFVQELPTLPTTLGQSASEPPPAAARTRLQPPKIKKRPTREPPPPAAQVAPLADDFESVRGIGGHAGQRASEESIARPERRQERRSDRRGRAAAAAAAPVTMAGPSSAAMALAAVLPAAEAIHAVHDIIYDQLGAIARAHEERTAQNIVLEGAAAGIAGEPPPLEETAAEYAADRSRGVKIPTGGLEGLRACCARCPPHPTVRIVQQLLGWTGTRDTDDSDVAAAAADQSSAVREAWKSEQQLSALWLLLEWLMPPREQLYPAEMLEAAKESAKRQPKRGGGGDAAAEAKGEMLLPPRMLLHVSAVPKILATLGRRGLFTPGEAVPFLFQAAMQL